MNLPPELTRLCAWKSPCERSVLISADCISVMDSLISDNPNGCFDMIFADPPYFLSNDGITCKSGAMVSVNKGGWDKSRMISEVHQFNMDWLSRCQKLLNPNGTIWVTGTHHNIYSVGFAMQSLGFRLLNDVIWEKLAPPPNLGCRNFTHSTETVLWASKGKNSKHLFNYALMKEKNLGKQMKTVWRLPSATKLEKSFGKHPTQKPLSLLTRCIEASTMVGDTIFDPFSGSSTTGVAAIQLERNFYGIELDKNFVDLSIQRLAATLRDKNGT